MSGSCDGSSAFVLSTSWIFSRFSASGIEIMPFLFLTLFV